MFDSDIDEKPDHSLRLFTPKKRSGRVLLANGKPAVGAQVYPASFWRNANKEKQIMGEVIRIPLFDQFRMVATTDAEGRFDLSILPGFRSVFRVIHPEAGETRWSAKEDVPLELTLPPTGSLSIATTGIDAKSIAGRRFTIVGEKIGDSKPVSYIESTVGLFDASGQASFPHFPVGDFTLKVEDMKLLTRQVTGSTPFSIKPGEAQKLELVFGPTATIRGRVVMNDKPTVGVANVLLEIRWKKSGAQTKIDEYYSVMTDRDGRYTVYGPKGEYEAVISKTPKGLAVYRTNYKSGHIKKNADVDKSTEMEPLVLTTTLDFVARVELNGKPVPQLKINENAGWFVDRRKPLMTNDAGEFRIPDLTREEPVSPRIRQGNAVNLVQDYELKNLPEKVIIDLSE
ncbi:MAG: MSCRAMM family protein, partial [Gemmataceae bacterium]